MANNYEDVIRERLNAQVGDMADELSRRLTECHRDAERRGVGDQFALALVIEAHAADFRSRGERFWRTVREVEIGPDEDPSKLSTALKRIARDQLGRSDRFLGIDQYAGRNGLETTDAQHAQLRGVRDRVLRDLDSRIDAHVYAHASMRPTWLARVTRKAHDRPALAIAVALLTVAAMIVAILEGLAALGWLPGPER